MIITLGVYWTSQPHIRAIVECVFCGRLRGQLIWDMQPGTVRAFYRCEALWDSNGMLLATSMPMHHADRFQYNIGRREDLTAPTERIAALQAELEALQAEFKEVQWSVTRMVDEGL